MRKSLKLISVIGKPIPVSLDLHHVSTDRICIGTAVENCNLVSGTTQLMHQGGADKTVSAD
jgi:hypothetical protein